MGCSRILGRTAVWIMAGLILGGCSTSSVKSPHTDLRERGAKVVEYSSFQDFLKLVGDVSTPDAKRDLVGQLEDWVAERGYPLTEDSLAHFLYFDEAAGTVHIPGDFNSWDVHADEMTRLEGTNLWYLSKEFPLDARLDYKFYVDGKWILDPRNSATCVGGFGPNSELAMPGYAQAPEIEHRAEIPHGKTAEVDHKDEVSGRARRIEIYLPPGYDVTTERYPALYVQDGSEYISLAGINHVADALIHEGMIRPVILVCIPPLDRGREYSRNERYMDYVVRQIVPYVDENFRTIADAGARGIMGPSLGGLISVFISSRHPEIFGNCAGQSTYFGGRHGQMITELERSPRGDVRWYFDIGTFEVSLSGANLLEENRYVRDLLLEKGYAVFYREYPEGHSWGSWRAHIDDILTFFWPRR